MNQTATRTRRRPGTAAAPEAAPSPRLPAVAAEAARAGLLAAVLGLTVVAVPVLLVWWGEDRSGTDVVDAVRSAVQLWLVAHGTWLQAGQGRLGLVPLGLSVLPLWLAWRAGWSAATRTGAASARAALGVSGAATASYASVAGVLSAAAGGGGFRPVGWTAVAGPVLLVGVMATAGAVRAARAAESARTPPDGWLSPRRAGVLRAGSAATLLLLGAGSLLTGAALALDATAAARVAEASEPGAVGGLGLALLGVVLLPNAAVWGASWLAGPGFAVGAGTTVGPLEVALGPVPSLPLLAALPAGAPPTWLGILALAVPLVAGGLAGWGFLREAAAGTPTRLLLDAAAAGVLAGALLGLLAVVSGGPLGGDRLAAVGPSAAPVAAAVAVEVALGVAVALVLRRRRARPAADGATAADAS